MHSLRDPMARAHCWRNAILTLSLILTTLVCPVGCVTSVIEKKPLQETTLLVSRSGQTSVLQWKTEPGVTYTVLYAPTRSARAKWQVLPGYARIRGTGGTFTIEDAVPSGQARHYRLHVEPGGMVR